MAAAAFAVALLPFALPQGGVHAQSADNARLRTVTNVAEARWDSNGTARRIVSNTVSFEVTAATAAPSSIRVYRRVPGAGEELTYLPPQCGPVAGPVQALLANATASITPAAAATAQVASASVQQTDALRGGEPLFFEITAPAANRDPAAIDTLTVVFTTTEGDRETMCPSSEHLAQLAA